ncbi:unnamed protein product [Bursaphelenchus okinawaensis]|uniref:Uncharacterized protein n=1 Tax=Bursaphelenchus okinawaensis TaxID=465554 RepID=A0A811KCN0_9BILA|nr:unnamed protein product [Bursaphelenchus okinawaensis]CAG9101760.1 unnamed protein product [Bursaphelenchus okinawaensis]
MHLYEATEQTNTILARKVSELKASLAQCQIAKNETLDNMLYTRRQFGKCMESRFREKRVKMEKVKQLVETIYDTILDVLNLN